MEVNKRLLGELEAMGFSEALATKALCSSGNLSIEEAINWLVDHDNDTAVSEPPKASVDITVEPSKPLGISEQVKLKAHALRNQARNKRVEQENKQEGEREKERIQADKELFQAKQIAEESERNRFLAQRKAEKENEKRARDRVRQKLQQDKLERRGILGLPREGPASLKPDVAFPEKTKNLQQVHPDFLPVKYAALRDYMTECLRSLKRRNKEESSGAIRAFQTLLIYVTNVINNPDEEKFRKIRISNPVFQDRVGKFEEGIKFLELCGFERVDGGKLFLPRQKVDMGTLKSAALELHNAMMNPYFGLLSV